MASEEKKPQRKHGRSILAMGPGNRKGDPAQVSQEGQKRSFAQTASDVSEGAGPQKDTDTAVFARKQPKSEGIAEPTAAPFAEIPAGKIRSWRYKDRTALELEDDEEFDNLVREIREEGVLTPVLVRPLEHPDSDGHEFEEVAGFKRVSAAKLLGPSTIVPAYIRSMTDLEAARAQKSENTGRSKPSTWSDAMHYKRLLDDGIAKSKADLAVALGLDRTTCSNMIRIAEKMPEDFIKAMKLTRLSFNVLMKMVSETAKLEGRDREELIDRIVEAADDINARPDKALKLLESVVEEFQSKGAPHKPTTEKWVFNSQKGKALSTKKADNQVSFTIHEAALSVVSHDELEELITKALVDRGLKLEKK